MKLYLDATALNNWGCREFFRQRQVLDRDTLKQNIHYEFGKAIHLAIELFWQGRNQNEITAAAYEVCCKYPTAMLNPNETDTWKRMVDQIPDLVAAYMAAVPYEPEKLMWVEYEWKAPYPNQYMDVYLCGRMDRTMAGPRIVDVKTASEISNGGIPWKQSYREEKLLEMQFGLYDWYLCQTGMPPVEVYLEVLLKGFKSKPSRYERIDLPEIISDAYRSRFRQQLAWKVSEIVHYYRNYLDQKPWPMNQQMCSNKFGRCAYLPICLNGETPKVMEKYIVREKHLEVMKESVAGAKH